MTSSVPATSLYNADYFRHGCGKPYERTDDWLQFFAGIAEKIVAEIAPRRVLDAGCALGFLVEGLRARGVEAYGLDISDYAIQHVREDLKPYCQVRSILEPLSDRYDLIVCIEVLEHLPPFEGEQAIANLCQATEDILFSSTPFDYQETSHFNTQPPDYWAEKFALHGFMRDVDFDATFITPWAIRFRRIRDPQHRLLRQYERRFWRLWQENHDLRQRALEMKDQSLALEAAQTKLTEMTRRPSWQIAWKIAGLLQNLRLVLAPESSLRKQLLDRWVRREPSKPQALDE